jgi:hypothetical protein
LEGIDVYVDTIDARPISSQIKAKEITQFPVGPERFELPTLALTRTDLQSVVTNL